MPEVTEAQRLAEANDTLIGTVVNGPWVLIPDPELRALVGGYVAETCHSVAAAAGLDEAMEQAHDAMPQRLATTLPAMGLAPVTDRDGDHLWLHVTCGTTEWYRKQPNYCATCCTRTDRWRQMHGAD